MPTDLDVYEPERWLDDALFRPEVRDAYRNLVAQGWTDAIRKLHPDERIYTFWDYLRNALARDAGLRIDHLLLKPSMPSGWSPPASIGTWSKTGHQRPRPNVDRTRHAVAKAQCISTKDPKKSVISGCETAMFKLEMGIAEESRLAE